MENGNIIQRFDALVGERRGSVEGLWDVIERFVLPFRGDFYQELSDEHQVNWERRYIYDSTAVFAVQSLAASLQGNLTSPSTLWFNLKFRNEELNKQDAAMEWLEQCTNLVFEALQDSNFNIEMSEAYIDLVGFGTAILTEEVEDEIDWKGINFQAIPVREMYFEEDHKKQIKILYRRLQWTPLQIISKFGDDTPEDIVKKAKDGPAGTSERETIIFVIYERDDKKDADTGGILAPEQRPYGYKYVRRNGAETLGKEGGYYEMPAYVARWRKVAGSRWGHSPTSVAMGDILTLNQLIEATLEAAGKAIDPVTFANESAILGDMDMDRGGFNIVTDITGIKSFESTTRFDVSNIEVSRLQESIEQAFYQDQLALKESPAMTATEVNVRYELMQRLLGPTLGRLQNDLLDPLVQRTFNIMFRAQQLPELPEGLEVSELDIEYTGPLPRAQKMETSQAINTWIADIGQMAQIYPDALDLVDVDEAVRISAQLRGVPAKAMKSEDQIKEDRKARKEQQQSAAGVEAARTTGEAAKAVGEGMDAMGVEDKQGALVQLQGGGAA